MCSSAAINACAPFAIPRGVEAAAAMILLEPHEVLKQLLAARDQALPLGGRGLALDAGGAGRQCR